MAARLDQRQAPRGTMFAVAHLDFMFVLWLYYVAVAALFGGVTTLTRSILPAVVLRTAGNLYSNLDLWMNGHVIGDNYFFHPCNTGGSSNCR